MSAIAELTISNPIFFGPTFDAVPDAELTFEDMHYVTNDDETVEYVFFTWAGECDLRTFESAVDEDETLDDFERLVELDDRGLYRIATPPRSEDTAPLLLPICRKHDVTILDSRRTATGFHVRVRAPNRGTLRPFRDDLADRGVTVEITKLSTATEETEFHLSELTSKQREALTLAYERGYFETPKAVTLSALAEELDVAPQTLSRHIRVGVQTLVEQAIESTPADSGRDPV